MSSTPSYFPNSCSVAFQLNWSVSVFGRAKLHSPEGVMDKLKMAIARDDLVILEYRKLDPNVVQFFISSQSKHSPADIVRSVKGRWCHVARDEQRIELRRNYCIRSVGTAKCSVLDQYVANQTSKHAMADANVQSMLESLQYYDPSVDVATVRRSGHGEFLNSLHLVLENNGGWRETSREILSAYRAQTVETCRSHNWWLSRIGLLSNHLHILLSAGIQDSPEVIATTLLNDLASTQKMLSPFKHSYFVGTFGGFDRGAIWNSFRSNSVSEKLCQAYRYS